MRMPQIGVTVRRLLAVGLTVLLLPVALRAAEPVKLRYGWQGGQRYAFEIEIVADRGEEIETLKGTPVLRVESVDRDGAKIVLQNKDLASTTRAKQPGRGAFRFPSPPRIPRGPGGPFGAFTGHEMTLDDRGRVVNQRGESQLPFVLGNLSQLLVEPLPAEAEAQWSRTESTGIRISSEWPPRSPFRQDVEKERLNAEETTRVTVEKVTPEAATLKREYRLQTVEAVDGKPRMEFSGSGTITFDRRRNLLSSMDYAANFIVRESNTETRYPITVKFHLLSDAELAEYEAKQARLAAERKAAPQGDERAQLIADLNSGDINKARPAILTLNGKEPDQPDAEMASALALFLSGEDKSLRSISAQILEKWATDAEIDPLVAALTDDSPVVVNAAMKALGRLRAAAAIDPIAEGLGTNQTRIAASAALIMMGSAAEEKVAGLLQHDDWVTRMEAAKVLKEIGTAKSLEALGSAARVDDNGLVKKFAAEAVEAIEARGAEKT
jgi:hypothetical protein